MAYNPYFPQFYPPTNAFMASPQPQMNPSSNNVQQTPQTANTGITWVQGENAAKSFPVAPNQSVLLMDSEDSVMYIKTTDASGMPMPLRIFDYTERKSNHADASPSRTSGGDFVSRTEFNEFKESIARSIDGIRNESIGEG